MDNFDKIQKIICEKVAIDSAEITESSILTDDLGLDSLEIIEIVMELEKEFNITIPDDEVENLLTVGHMVNKVDELTS